MAEITSREELEDWLKDKPTDWAQVIAARVAMRLFPVALNNNGRISHNSNFFHAIFFDVLYAWYSCNVPNLVTNLSSRPRPDGNLAASAIAQCVIHERPWFNASSAINSAANSIAGRFKSNVPEGAEKTNPIWLSVHSDLAYLESTNTESALEVLSYQPLWRAGTPNQFSSEWRDVIAKSIDLDINCTYWIDWYERRLLGEETGFDIPYDINHIEDKAIYVKLTDASSIDFWSKGAEYVNQQLSDWLREARERAQERYDAENAVGDDIDTEISIPNQNTNAITFHRGETGKIAVNQTASSDEILKDADSVERHQLALEEALEIRRKCETSNAGARLTQLLENYLNSIGQSLEEIKPSMAVQRGEKLRQEIASYEMPDNMLPPISDEILLDLKSWQSAHNMIVGLQPKLNALDTSMLGPDRQPAEFTPDDLRKLANDAENLELIEVSTKEILDETVDQADGVKDYKDRKFVWSAETAKNLVVEAINIAKDKPKTAITSVTTIAAGLSNPSVSIPLAIIAAGFLIKNRNWVETKMGNAQTWKSLFSHLCDTYDGIINFDKNDP